MKASRQVIKSKSPEDWGNDVSFTGMDGLKLFITRDTAGKARFRNSLVEKGEKKTYTDDEYALKHRIESHIDEIAQVSRWNGKSLEPDRKNHPFAKDGFSYRTAFFEDFDGQY